VSEHFIAELHEKEKERNVIKIKTRNDIKKINPYMIV